LIRNSTKKGENMAVHGGRKKKKKKGGKK